MITIIKNSRRGFLAFTGAAAALGVVGCGNAPPAAAPTASVAGTSGSAAKTVTITDQWERTVTVPRDPKRVIVVEWEGLVTKSMRAFGVDDRLVGVDRPTKEQSSRRVIIPGIANATAVGTVFSGLNEEQLAGLRPDVIFLEAWASDPESKAKHQKVIDRLEALKIPTVVLLSPSNFPEPDLRTAWQIITITGAVFGQEQRATQMVQRIQTAIAEVTRRVPTSGQKPKAAIFATEKYVMGPKSIQSFMLTSLLRADNVATTGTFVPVSEEKLLALDPDVLLLIGHEGYLSVAEVTDGRKVGLDWKALGSMRAIRTGRLTALGYDEWRATVETPVALMKLGKALYPESFADVDVAAFELSYYRDVFKLDEATARAAIKGQEFAGDLKRS